MHIPSTRTLRESHTLQIVNIHGFKIFQYRIGNPEFNEYSNRIHSMSDYVNLNPMMNPTTGEAAN